jgi:carboxylesterase
MIRSRWTDWVASVEDGYHLLCGLTGNIFLIGLSMGGILSLLLSTQLEVRGVIAMSTPSQLPTDYPIWFLKLFSLVKPYNEKRGGAPDSGWFDKTAYQVHVAYEKNPVRSVAELKELMIEMRRALPRVNVPVLLMHSKEDQGISSDEMEIIYEELVNASDKTKLYLMGSGHVLPRDASREQVFQSALEFIQRVNKQK